MKKILLFLIMALTACSQTPPPAEPVVKDFVPEIQVEEKREAEVPDSIKWGDWELNVVVEARNSTPVFMYFYDLRKDSRKMNYVLHDKRVTRFINDNFKPFKFHTSGFDSQIIAKLLHVDTSDAPIILVLMPSIDDVNILEFKGPLDKETILQIPFLPYE